jgi:anti-anti-sigma factor
MQRVDLIAHAVTFVLGLDHGTAGKVRQAHGAFRLVRMLPPWPAGAEGVDTALRQQSSIRQGIGRGHAWDGVLLTAVHQQPPALWESGAVVLACTTSGSQRVNIERNNGICRMLITDDPIFLEFNFRSLILDRLTDADLKVIIDLSLVQSLHSPGLANLVSIHISLQKRGRSLVLTGLNEHNLRLLKATNLDRLLVIE